MHPDTRIMKYLMGPLLLMMTTTHGCNMCGINYVVTAPDEVVPGYGNVTCGHLQATAETGALGDCTASLQALIFDPCGCQEDPSSPGPIANGNSTLVACDICGPGRVVSAPDNAGILPDHPDVSCGQLQQSAEASQFSATACDLMQGLVDTVCGCRDDPRLKASEATAEQPAATEMATAATGVKAPSSTTSTPCNICGDGGYLVTKADIRIPGYPNITCGHLQAAAEIGALGPRGACSETLTELVFEPCGCEAGSAAAAASSSSSSDAQDGTSTIANADPTLALCDICGPDMVVSTPDHTGILPDHPDVSCGQLQQSAEASQFSTTTCDMIQGLVYTACGCRDDPRLTATTIATPMVTSNAPCSVCGEGREITQPYELLQFDASDPYNEITSCAALQDQGRNGTFSEEYCKELPLAISTDCGCQDIHASDPSTAPIAVTTAPVEDSPTAPPAVAPTAPIEGSSTTTVVAEQAATTSDLPIPESLTGEGPPCSLGQDATHHSNACWVCGTGSCVTSGDGMVQVGSAVTTCEKLERHAATYYAMGDTKCDRAMQSVTNINHCACHPITSPSRRSLTE